MTLDDDVAERLADLARESSLPFKVVVNDALRRGLGGPKPREPKFVIKPHCGNLRSKIDDRRLNELVWEFEEERLARKLLRRKP